MGRNAVRLSESKLDPENLKGVKLYHTADAADRESIESHGLKKSKPWDDEPSGVYLKAGEPYRAREAEGQDVYEVTPDLSKIPVHEDTLETGNVFIPRNIPTSDFKRVGHYFRNSSGHPEIHWHKEEDCDGRSVNGA